MAVSKTSRAYSLKRMGASNLLPSEINKMAGEMERMVVPAGEGSNLRKEPAVDARLTHKTKDRYFDRDESIHAKSTLGYLPPSRR